MKTLLTVVGSVILVIAFIMAYWVFIYWATRIVKAAWEA
jgi:energy-converting hydrogenase Eha subunit F